MGVLEYGGIRVMGDVRVWGIRVWGIRVLGY